MRRSLFSRDHFGSLCCISGPPRRFVGVFGVRCIRLTGDGVLGVCVNLCIIYSFEEYISVLVGSMLLHILYTERITSWHTFAKKQVDTFLMS